MRLLPVLLVLLLTACPDVVPPQITQSDAADDTTGNPDGADGTSSDSDGGTSDGNGSDADVPDGAGGDQGPDGDTTGTDADVGPDLPDDDVPLAPCSPALGFSASSYSAVPNSFTTLTATGGGGQYRYELLTATNGAIMHPSSGVFLAGGTLGAQDTVEVTDQSCIGSAQVNVDTVGGVTIAPSDPTVPPGTAISFVGEGGSGSYVYSFANNGSGATIDGSGGYTAGISGGTDVIVMTDTGTNDTAYATVTVIAGVKPTGAPSILYVAMGQTQSLNIADGSGEYTFTSSDPSIAAIGPAMPETGNKNAIVVATSPGSATVTATDVYTALTIDLEVMVVTGQTGPMELPGDGNDRAVLAFGDVDGDGISDAVYGRYTADVEAWDGGAVFVYKGTDSGFEPVPLQVIGWPGRQAYFGRSVALADLDGDNILDLLVGADRADIDGRTDNGAVIFYRGIAGGGFETEPAWTRSGDHNSDYLGFSVAACDFNGDGFMDFAAGAQRDEDRTLDPVVSDQGGVWLYLGTPSGFPEEPDQIIYGETPSEDGTAIAPQASIYLGSNMAVGDHDGDGVCDLAVSAERYATPGFEGARTNDGAVLMYRGVKAIAPNLGGLEPLPMRAIRGSDEGPSQSRFGRNLALGDVTGDGTDDLLLGQYAHDEGGFNSCGAARLFLGDNFTLPPFATWEAPGDNDWAVFGSNSTDYYGWDVAIGDVDGVPPLDLVSANLLGETEGGQGNAGYIAVFPGVLDGVPAASPTLALSSQMSGTTRFGGAVGVAPDMDGDGAGDFLVLAGRDDSYAYEGGRLFFVPATVATDETLLEPLDSPEVPSGSRFGWAVSVVGDVTANGHPDLVVGAPLGDVPGEGLNSGRIFIYEGVDGGFADTATAELTAFNAFSSSDQWGQNAAGLGDFDGDSDADFAVLGYSDDVAASVADDYFTYGTCPTAAMSNTGSVAVFSGSATLATDEPAFLVYGLDSGQYTEALTGGGDINGDGRADLAFGTRYSDEGGTNSGAFSVVFGRDRLDPTATTVICEPDFSYKGFEASGYVGVNITIVGDVNADGCDEIAVGAYGQDWASIGGGNNKGGVFIVFGWGTDCDFQEPRILVLEPGLGTGVQAGYSLAGGHPIDALDTIPDLAVGGLNFPGQDGTNGGVALISGAYIAGLADQAEVLTTGQPPTTVHPFQPELSTTNYVASASGTGGQVGRSVALLPNATTTGRAAIIAGAPFSNLGGIAQSGGAAVFVGSADGGLRATPVATFGGEGHRPGGRLGERVSAGELADGSGALVVGGYWGSSFSLDQGSVYVLPWTLWDITQ